PQACTSALTKSGDDPILQTIIEASPLIAHVKITSIGGGVVFKSGVAIFTAQAEITQLYKAPFQIKEDIQFNFDRFAYLSFEADEYSDFKKRRQAFQEPLRVEKDKEYIVFLKLPDGPLVNPNPTDEQFFYTLADRFLGAQPYDKYLEERVMQYASPPKIVTSLDENQCVDLAREVAAMLDEANYCAQDSDCMVFETHFRCDIIGCYAFVSKNTNRESIQKSISNYTKNGCPVTSDCLCAFPPKQQDVKCIANKCVDTRLPQ
ncbi:MAG: hypothetical protein HY564_03175, partial [Candidatus Jacksonbacteria bacterium]|nr:hypothetical protein [Candidatus Jacksonbacteria bacterium]